MTGYTESYPSESSSSGGGDFIGSLVNAGADIYTTYQNKKMNEDTIRANRELAEYQYDKNYQMWLEMNAYQSPRQQMERLRAAGLNPNLVYGASSPSGDAAPAPKYQAPIEDHSYQVRAPRNIIQEFQDIELKNAQIDQTRAVTANVEERTATQSILSALRGYDAEEREAQSDYFHEDAKNKSGRIRAALDSELGRLRQIPLDEQQKVLRNSYMQNRVDHQQIEKERKEVDLFIRKKEAELRKAGFKESDHILFRILNRGLNEVGYNIWDLWKIFD